MNNPTPFELASLALQLSPKAPAEGFDKAVAVWRDAKSFLENAGKEVAEPDFLEAVEFAHRIKGKVRGTDPKVSVTREMSWEELHDELVFFSGETAEDKAGKGKGQRPKNHTPTSGNPFLEEVKLQVGDTGKAAYAGRRTVDADTVRGTLRLLQRAIRARRGNEGLKDALYLEVVDSLRPGLYEKVDSALGETGDWKKAFRLPGKKKKNKAAKGIYNIPRFIALAIADIWGLPETREGSESETALEKYRHERNRQLYPAPEGLSDSELRDFYDGLSRRSDLLPLDSKTFTPDSPELMKALKAYRHSCILRMYPVPEGLSALEKWRFYRDTLRTKAIPLDPRELSRFARLKCVYARSGMFSNG